MSESSLAEEQIEQLQDAGYRRVSELVGDTRVDIWHRQPEGTEFTTEGAIRDMEARRK